MPSKIAVVVLAAGASKRMGVPKQLLKWGNGTLITHTIQTVLKLNADAIYVVLGANFQLIKKTIHHFPITILNNENWEHGLGTSIACASKFIQNEKPEIDALLFILADQPFITADYLNKIILSFSPNEKQIVEANESVMKALIPPVKNVDLDFKEDYERLYKENFEKT